MKEKRISSNQSSMLITIVGQENIEKGTGFEGFTKGDTPPKTVRYLISSFNPEDLTTKEEPGAMRTLKSLVKKGLVVIRRGYVYPTGKGIKVARKEYFKGLEG